MFLYLLTHLTVPLAGKKLKTSNLFVQVMYFIFNQLGDNPTGVATLLLVKPSFSLFQSSVLLQTKPSIILLVGVALLLFMAGIYFVRVSQKRSAKRIKKLEKEVQIQELIALRAQINPHFVCNCLTAIQHLLYTGKNEEASEYLAQFGVLNRAVLDSSTRFASTLEEELKLLDIYIRLEQLRFDRPFAYKVNLHKNVSPSELYIPPLLLHPIVENAIWHGLFPVRDKRDGLLEINIHCTPASCIFEILDNGKGTFLPAEARQERLSGLQLTRKRLESITQLYPGQTAELVHFNRDREACELNGTSVRLALPLSFNLLQDL